GAGWRRGGPLGLGTLAPRFGRRGRAGLSPPEPVPPVGWPAVISLGWCGAVRGGSAALMLDLLLAGAVACTCPVLLAAAIPRAVAVVSGLAQRPRSGLALTRRTRLRSSEARRTSPAVFAWTSTGHLYPSSCPGVTDGLGARWRRPIIARRRGMGEPLHLLRSRPRGPGQASSAAGCRALMRRRGEHTAGCRGCYSSFSGI